MLTTSALKRALWVTAAFSAICLTISALLGSDGPTDDDQALGQQIANVTFVGIFLGLVLLALIGIAYAVAATRERRRIPRDDTRHS